MRALKVPASFRICIKLMHGTFSCPGLQPVHRLWLQAGCAGSLGDFYSSFTNSYVMLSEQNSKKLRRQEQADQENSAQQSLRTTQQYFLHNRWMRERASCEFLMH